jgi:Transcriptional regulatory protein, C terminal
VAGPDWAPLSATGPCNFDSADVGVGAADHRGVVTLGYFRRLLGRTRTLDSHASGLRRKLNGASDTAYVLNVWGVGYRLVATAG